MRFSVLIACYIWLFCGTVAAQTTVSGRLLDAKSGDALSGATILQSGTANGISSDDDGNFTLTIPAALDSVALTFSSIGYITQRRRVAAGSNIVIKLQPDLKPIISCGLASPKVTLALASGIQYTPIGGSLTVYGPSLAHIPLTGTVNYLTNISRSHVLIASLDLPLLSRRNGFQLSEQLGYQRLRIDAATTDFESYTATAGLWFFRYTGNFQIPEVLLGAGYARLKSHATDATTSISGPGFSAGLRGNALPYPFHVYGQMQARYWPGHWQWQGRLAHTFANHLEAGVAFNMLGQYKELAASVGLQFY